MFTHFQSVPLITCWFYFCTGILKGGFLSFNFWRMVVVKMNIITHKAKHTERNYTAFHRELSYISEEKAVLSAHVYQFGIGHQVPTSQQVVHIRHFPFSGSQMKYQQGFGREVHQRLFPGNSGCKDVSPPFSLLKYCDWYRQMFLELYHTNCLVRRRQFLSSD